MTPETCPLCHGPVTISGRFAWCNKRRQVDRCGWGPVDLTRVAKKAQNPSAIRVSGVETWENRDGPSRAVSVNALADGAFA